MEKHSFDQTPFLTVAFTVDCQNTTKSIWKEFSPHPTRVQQEPIFASKFKCIKNFFFYRGLPLIHYRERPKEIAWKCIKEGSHS